MNAWFTTLLTVLLTCTTPRVVHAQFLYETNNGAITITRYVGSDSEVTIPGSIDGLPVTSIGVSAFWQCASVTRIVVPNGVTNIGPSAFHFCTSLSSIELPNSVLSLGYSAFQFCTSLESVSLPDGLRSVAGSLFYQCTGLQSVSLPSGLLSIDINAFMGCSSLRSIVLPDGVTKVGDGAFTGCTSLTSVSLPHSLTNLGGYVFKGCTSLSHIHLPDQLTLLTYQTFYGCASLESITIPRSVTTFGSQVFAACPNLSQVYFQGNAPRLYGGPGVFSGDAPNLIIYYLPDTLGWGASFDGWPTVLWNPHVQPGSTRFDAGANSFGFTIVGTPDIPIVVEASTSLASPDWVPLQSCTLTNGSLPFSDPEWRNYPARLYRFRAP